MLEPLVIYSTRDSDELGYDPANADSYATFAQECLADRPDKPPFVESRPGGLAGAR